MMEDSYGIADFFLTVMVAVPRRAPPLAAVASAPAAAALLVFTEARKYSDGDWGAKGIGMRASYDRGRTWQTMVQVVTDPPQAADLTQEWNTSLNSDTKGINGLNLGAATYDSLTGTTFVHFTTCAMNCTMFSCVQPKYCPPEGHARLWYVSSNDSFVSWSDPVEITQQIGPVPSSKFIVGPGEGTQSRSGRLIICGYGPTFVDAAGGKHNWGASSLILSDDHGRTWRQGARLNDVKKCTRCCTSECDAAMLANGSVLVTMRSQGGYGTRVQARSDDEGQNFVADSFRPIEALPDPGCQGSIIRYKDALFLSHPHNNSERVNMTLMKSVTEGDTWGVHDVVWPSYSGYGSIAGIPDDDAVAIAFNRGIDGDGCVGTACPYSTFITFAVIPLNESRAPTASATPVVVGAVAGSDDGAHTRQAAGLRGESGQLLTFGWWRMTPPDSQHPATAPPRADEPGFLDGIDRVVVALVDAEGAARFNHSQLLAAGGSPGFPQPLSNGSALSSPFELVQFGRAQWPKIRDKFVFSENVSTNAWLEVARDASCYRRSNHQDIECGVIMRQYGHSLCSALADAGLDWWMIDATSIVVDREMLVWFGDGVAQTLRFAKQTCLVNYNVSLTLGWALSDDTGHLRDSLLFQNFTTFWETEPGSASRVASRAEPALGFLDVFLVSTQGSTETAKHYCSNVGASYPGECSPGRDASIMEWTHWSAVGHIPADKLVVQLPTRHTAIHSCPFAFDANSSTSYPLRPCMPVGECTADKWTAGDANHQSSQKKLLEAVEAGKMEIYHDTWAQQSYLTGSADAPLNWVDTPLAQDFDFALRHAHWRGVAGVVSQCLDDDFTRAGAVGRRWSQPAAVLQRFRRSEVYTLSVGDAANASHGGLPDSNATGLDLSSGDSICRMFGARLASLADLERAAKSGAVWDVDALVHHTVQSLELGGRAVITSVVTRPENGRIRVVSPGRSVHAVHCFGQKPEDSAAAWPFQLAVASERHSPGLPFDLTIPTGAATVWQLAIKSSMQTNTSVDVEAATTDETYLRQVPITPDSGRVLAALVGGTVASQPQVGIAAAAGARRVVSDCHPVRGPLKVEPRYR
jgi:hypothetical protein